MNRHIIQITAFLVFFALITSACGFGGKSDLETSTPAPEAVFTSAAQTAEALRMERFAQTATLPAEAIIETSAFATATPTVAAATLGSSPTLAATAATQAPAGSDRGEYVADVSIPDGTVLAPNQTFKKTWRVANTGSSTWTSAYSLIYIDGALMGAEATVPLELSTAPGEQVELSINMVAPPDPGSYRGYWKLRNANGQVFGFGTNGDEAIWVDIVVGEGAALLSTAEATKPAGPISAVLLKVDQADVTGSCPHTFIFTAQITLGQPATLSYVLEAGSLTGSNVRLPQPRTQNLGSGAYPVVYELSIPLDVDGWARLHVTDPVEMYSNQVDFSLVCT